MILGQTGSFPLNDNQVIAPDLSAIQQLSETGSKIFLYNFNFRTPNFPRDYNWISGADHSSDLIYITGGVYDELVKFYWNGDADFSREETKMGDLMMEVWFNFINKDFDDEEIYSSRQSGSWMSYKTSNCSTSENECQIFGEFNQKSINDPEIKYFLREEGTVFWNDYIQKLGRIEFDGEIQPEYNYPELTEIDIEGFTLTGIKKSKGVRYFGIQFADIPNRFEYSNYKPISENIHSKTNYSESCVNFDKSYNSFSGIEDCLYLDIILPTGHNVQSYSKGVV